MMKRLVAAGLLMIAVSGTAMARATNVVLVPGATMDGSGWRAVYDILRANGLAVSVVQLPQTSLEDDITATRLIIEQQMGPTVLVGHSYGGAVITEAGFESNVKALVYIAALQPDNGETLTELSKRFPMHISMKMLDHKTFVPDPTNYHDNIAADLPRELTDFLSASSKPMTLEPYSVKIKDAAWRVKPSFGIVTTDDRTVPPELQKWMYARAGTKTTEIKSSHMVYMSHPQDVAKVILDAVESVD